MAEYVFNEEGVPVLRPFSGRRKYGFMETSAANELPTGGASAAGNTLADLADDVKLLSHIFDIEEKAYDVILTRKKIAWAIIGGQRASTSSRSLSRKSSITTKYGTKENRLGACAEVAIRDLFAVAVHRQKTSHSAGEGICKGVELHTYERRPPNKLKHKIILLAHPSSDVCNLWTEKIRQFVQGITGRPRRVRIYLNPYAGDKQARQDFKGGPQQLLELAGIQMDIYELDKRGSIKDDLATQDLSSYDAIVAMGGDGTASEVINHLLLNSQSAGRIKADTSFTPARSSLPVAIMPCGTTNHICHSVVGTADMMTSTIHLIYGNRILVDICSISNKENFLSFGFNAHYGFGGNVLSYVDRYQSLGSKKIGAAFLKGLSKAKFRPYSVELSYVPTHSQSHPMDGVKCRTGCSICSSNCSSDPSSECIDSLLELDPLALSSTSSTITDLTAEKTGSKIIKGDYLNISVLSIPGNNDMAPEGLSKCAHLGDGCADLVLVKNVKRKEFVRHLKRFGNAKNQFDFPFVEVHRVKEVRVNPRMSKGWQFRGDFNEITYEMKRREQQSVTTSGSAQDTVKEIGGSDGDDNDDELPAQIDDDSSDDDIPQLNLEGTRGTQSAGSGSRSGTPSGENRGGSAGDGKDRSTTNEPYVQMNYRALEMEKLRARRKRKDDAKEKKDKEKAEMLVRSVWNIDNSLVKNEVELSFRVHRHLVTLFGQGISPDTPSEEAKVSCLPIFS